MGGATIDFQGGHADALSNKPHKGLFACPLGRRSWWRILSNAHFFLFHIQWFKFNASVQCME